MHIFRGSYYNEWRWCLECKLDASGLGDLLFESSEEVEYLQQYVGKQKGLNAMPDYTKRQCEAQVILAERLELKYIRKIREAVTIRLMLEILDDEYTPSTSNLSVFLKKEKYLNLKFNDDCDIREYIELHEKRAFEYEEAASAELTNRDKIMNLSSSVPIKYFQAYGYCRSTPEFLMNYNTYRQILIDVFDQMSLGDAKRYEDRDDEESEYYNQYR